MMDILFSNADRGVLDRAKSEGLLRNAVTKEVFERTFVLFPCADTGDLRGYPFGEGRRALFRQHFYTDRWTDEPEAEAEDSFFYEWERYLAAHGRFLALAKAGEPVRIWYGRAPWALCGFLCAVHALEGLPCPVSAAELPAHAAGDPSRPLVGWGQLRPEEVPRYLHEVPLSPARRGELAGRWEALVEENAPLRAVVNGQAVSVGEDYYDSILDTLMGEKPFKVSHLVIDFLHACPQVGDFIPAWRLKEKLRRGELAVVTREERFYDSVLKRS